MPNRDNVTIHIVADSIPQAYYRAISEVWKHGRLIRTEYDKKDSKDYVVPPSRDVSAVIEIKNPLSQPRFPPVSFCEIGKYIAEIMGAKDHLVVSTKELLEKIEKGGIENTHWPYTYHQRLWQYPREDGRTINQIQIILERLANSLHTRRAVAATYVPYIDAFLKEDQPCLREIELRCFRENEIVQLDMITFWRSRDLYRAWPDNVIGITNWHQRFAYELSEKIGEEVKVGNYIDFTGSLHIYGECLIEIEGDSKLGIKGFFDNFPTEQDFINRSMTSEKAKDLLIIPQLEELKEEKEWNFPQGSIEIIDILIEDYKSVKFLP